MVGRDVKGEKKLLKMLERLVALLQNKVRTEGNIELRKEIILSQEYQPAAHPTPVDIACEPNIDRRWVSRVIDQRPSFWSPYETQGADLNTEKHMLHSRKLLSNLTQKTLQPAFFSGEKIFKVEKTL